jgi:hypothetical protein
MSGDEGYHRAVEWRLAKGTWGRGPVAVWLRLRVPLVAGETPTLPLDAATTSPAHGIGLTRARLWDTAGLVGRSLQTLLLEPRSDG